MILQPGSYRCAYRYGIHAILHRVRAHRLLARRAWPYPVWPVAIGRLHRLPGITIHCLVHHCGPVLLSENCCQVSVPLSVIKTIDITGRLWQFQVPFLEDWFQGWNNDHLDLDHPCRSILHQHLWLAAFYRQKRLGPWRLLCSIS